jgi:tetratricopeptide (TPR) repeat protein
VSRYLTLSSIAMFVAILGWTLPAAADDVENCTWANAKELLKTKPSLVQSSCQRLAKDGQTWAQYNLAVIYDQALGVSPDYKEAAKWYKRAARKGHPQAQYNLGRLYANGLGVQADFIESYKWFQLAADGLPPGIERDRAIRNRDKVAQYMMPQQILEAEAMVSQFEPVKPK